MEKNMQKNLSRYTHIYIKLNFARHQKPIQHCKSTLTSILKRQRKKNRSILSVCVLSRFSHFWLFVTPWTVACQAPLSMGFSRQESWSGLPCPPPGDILNPGIKPTSLTSPVLADAEPPGKPNSFLVIVVHLPSCLLSYLSANHFKNLGSNLEFLKAHWRKNLFRTQQIAEYISISVHDIILQFSRDTTKARHLVVCLRMCSYWAHAPFLWPLSASGLPMLFFSHSVVSDSTTSWTAACQASLSFTISRSLLKIYAH